MRRDWGKQRPEQAPGCLAVACKAVWEVVGEEV